MFTLIAQSDPSTIDNLRTQAEKTAEQSGKAISDVFVEAFQPIINLIPNLLAMLLILVLGYAIAKILAKATRVFSEKIGLQTAAQRSGLEDSMKQVGLQRDVPAILGLIVFWLLMSVSIMAGAKVLGLAAVSDVMQEVVNWIPNVLIATVVIVIGLLVANFVRGVIATSADRVGVTYAGQLATGCYCVLVLVTFLAAANHLGMKLELVERMIQITFAALAVGAALALGLGGRDVMGGILSGYYIRQRFQSGDHVSVSGLEGNVREVGPVATIIESEEDGLMHRHSIPNQVMLKEAVR